MLEWAKRHLSWSAPANYNDLFQFRNMKGETEKVAYDPAALRKMLAKATDRQRLYVTLALNTGAYQSDIGNLRRDEIVERPDGTTAIVRRRSKTSHQNDFKSVHALWPETARLLKAEMGKTPASSELALTTTAGTPLYRCVEGGRFDGIGHAHQKLREACGVKIGLKQFRKMGASAMERIGGRQARRLYKAGTIDSGDAVYVTEAWENLTPVLMRWGEELRAEGVLY